MKSTGKKIHITTNGLTTGTVLTFTGFNTFSLQQEGYLEELKKKGEFERMGKLQEYIKLKKLKS